MRRLLISALLLCSAPVSAQHLAPEDYIFPLRNVAGLYSANFGEMRPNHFHSGIDIKTDGMTGKPVLATADGYISRIAVTPGGYGRAIYITHPNGTTSVYGHLSKFRDDIEKYVHEERYRTRRNSINLYPSADRFPLKQGEQFAWSGNTGSSAGPHLHFEIRDSRTQRTLNTISSGVIRTRDDIPPRLVKLYYVEVDSVRGVPVHARPRPVELVEKTPGRYALKQEGALSVGGRGVTSSWKRPTAKTTYPTHSGSGAYANLQTKIRSSSFVSTASPSTRPATATPSPTTPCRSPRATK